MNKPAGVVSTAREPGRRQAVVDLVDSEARLYPVGRLDVDSTGLLLLTNDGELANRLTHPRYEVPKAYRVALRRPPGAADLRRLARGVELEDGTTAPAEVRRLGEREVEIVLREGRNRQVRRMAEAVGNEVVALQRVRFGPVELGAGRRGGGAAARRRRGRGSAGVWEDARMSVNGEMRLFAVRGAVQAEANEAEAIAERDDALMGELMARNGLDPEAMVSCLFTTTDDLDAEFPAVAGARAGARRGAAALLPRDPGAGRRCRG